MTFIRPIFILLFSALVVMTFPADIQAIGLKPKPARLMEDAFEKVDAADEAVEDKKTDKGVALYREALDIFNSISRDYPLWNPELLDLKRSYCEHQLSMALEMRGQPASPEPLPAPLPPPSTAPEPSDETPAGPSLLPPPAVTPTNPADLATKEELLDIIDELQKQLKAKNAPKGDR